MVNDDEYSIQRTDIRSAKSWELYRYSVAFFTCVSLIHKILVPLFLKTTRLSGTQYSQLDPWIILLLVYGVWIFRSRKIRIVGSILAGAVVGYAAIETLRCLQGQYTRWLVFSHALSSIPIGVTAVIGLTFKARGRRLAWAWGAAILMVSVKYVTTGWVGDKVSAPARPVSESEIPISAAPSREVAPENPKCGALKLGTRGQIISNTRVISIRDCGFEPPLFSLAGDQLEFVNQSSKSFNVRMYLKTAKLKTAWNMYLKSGERRKSPQFHVGEARAGMIFSDALPELGISAFVVKTVSKTNEDWIFSRTPPSIEPIEEHTP